MTSSRRSPYTPERSGARILLSASLKIAAVVAMISSHTAPGQTTAGPVIVTIAGKHVWGGYSGDGGPATEADLSSPTDIALGAGGDLYFPDFGNHVIRKITPGGI